MKEYLILSHVVGSRNFWAAELQICFIFFTFNLFFPVTSHGYHQVEKANKIAARNVFNIECHPLSQKHIKLLDVISHCQGFQQEAPSEKECGLLKRIHEKVIFLTLYVVMHRLLILLRRLGHDVLELVIHGPDGTVAADKEPIQDPSQ